MSTLSATITADTSQFNSAVTKAKGELEKLTNVSKKQRTEFDKAVRTIDRVREGYIKGDNATKALNSSVQKLTQLHAELKAANNPLADSILRVANAAAKEKTNIDKVVSSVNKLKSSSANSGDLFKGVGDSFKDFSTLASAFNSGGLVSALGSLAGPLSVVTVAFAGLNEVIKNNETLFDKWQGVVSGAGTAWKNFMRTFNFSTIGASFKAGQDFYDASDALGSFRALDAERRASILERVQQAKTDKKEGKPWSKEQLNTLKKDWENYSADEAKMLEDVAVKKKDTLLEGLEGTSKTLAEEFFKNLDNDKNRYALLEDYKRKYKLAEDIVNKYKQQTYRKVTGQNGQVFYYEDPQAVKKLIKEDPEYAKAIDEVKAYGFLIDSEPDIHEYVKILTDKAVVSQENYRLIGEIAEAVATPKKVEDVKKDINKLHEENAKLKKEIADAQAALRGFGKVSPQDVDIDKLQENIKKVVDNRKKMEDLYATFESTPVNEYWRLVTEFDNAILQGPEEFEHALKGLQKSVDEYVKKYAELGYNVEELWRLIQESREVSDIYGGGPLNVQPITYEDLKKGWNNYALSKKGEIGTKTLQNENKIIESLQEQGIRPYKPFVFEDYKKSDKEQKEQGKDRINQIGLEVVAVNDLASAWGNLWEIIGIGNDKTKQTLQALGGAVTDAANLFKTLAENELAAAQAVALGKATSSASGLPFPYNLVAMGAVAASVTSMFARFASIGKFAEGGIVGGNSTIGDYNIARVNSGEMILNGTQQKRLFNMLNGEGGQVATNSQPQTVELVIRGKDLVGTFNNYNNRLNRVR